MSPGTTERSQDLPCGSVVLVGALSRSEGASIRGGKVEEEGIVVCGPETGLGCAETGTGIASWCPVNS